MSDLFSWFRTDYFYLVADNSFQYLSYLEVKSCFCQINFTRVEEHVKIAKIDHIFTPINFITLLLIRF